MSARTESQASSLEETAASMEELNTTFQKNDESSQHVSQLAAKAAGAVRATRLMRDFCMPPQITQRETRFPSAISGVAATRTVSQLP